MSTMRGEGMEGDNQNHLIIDMPSTPINETFSSSPPPYDPTQHALPQYTSTPRSSDADTARSRPRIDEKTGHLYHQSLATHADSDSTDISSTSYQHLKDENNALRNHNTALRAILFPSLIILIVLFTCFVFVNASILRSRRLFEIEMLQEIVVLRKDLGEARTVLKALGS